MNLTITADNGKTYLIQNIPMSINRYDKRYKSVSHRDLDVINAFVKHPFDVKTKECDDGALACDFKDIKECVSNEI